MEHFFNLEFTYEDATVSYPARLVTFGYSFKFYVVVNSQELEFEKDDEGQYRVLTEQHQSNITNGLLQSIITALQAIQQ